MSDLRPIITVGFDKNGECDFRVHVSDLRELSYERMTQVRAMVCVAIGTMEEHWSRHGPVAREMAACQAAERQR